MLIIHKKTVTNAFENVKYCEVLVLTFAPGYDRIPLTVNDGYFVACR